MFLRRLKLSSLTVVVAALTGMPADACCLTDWLFGRTATPYSVGYAPYSASYAPYSAGYTPYLANGAPYVAGYAPVSGFGATTVLPRTTSATNSGVYQLQRPTYLENPSVSTGAPVGTPLQTAYSVPLSTPQLFRSNPSLLGAGSTSSYFGASNTYPRYAAGFGGVSTANYPSATVLPATRRVAPMFPNAPRPVYRGGLARFFGSLFGTNYRTSYYAAPVTYYRPVTSVNPVLGTTVTVQQPCTSTVQQLQRSPYGSFQLPQTSITPIGGPIPTGSCASGVHQAAAVFPQGLGTNPFTVPIPSTTLAPGGYGGGYAQAPATGLAPLTGNPTAPQFQSDLSPVDQPSLRRVAPPSGYGASRYSQGEPQSHYKYESKPLSDREESRPEPTPPRESRSVPSYWGLQDADDSTAMLPKKPTRSVPSFVKNNHPIRGIDQDDTDHSPFRSDLMRRESDRRLDSDEFRAPLLPSHSEGASDSTSVSNSKRRSRVQQAAAWIPVREASVKHRSTAPRFVPRTRPVPPKETQRRDNRWSAAR